MAQSPFSATPQLFQQIFEPLSHLGRHYVLILTWRGLADSNIQPRTAAGERTNQLIHFVNCLRENVSIELTTVIGMMSGIFHDIQELWDHYIAFSEVHYYVLVGHIPIHRSRTPALVENVQQEGDDALTEPLSVTPAEVLGRLVADPLDPLRELAPPMNIQIAARVITTLDVPKSPTLPTATSGVYTHRHMEPWSTWDSLNLHQVAAGAIRFFLELHPKAFFVVGAKTRRRTANDRPVVIGQDEPDMSEKLDGDEEVISELEYVQVSTGKDGGLIFVEYGTILDAKLSHARKWSHDHPAASRAIKAAAIGVGVAAAVPLAVTAVLGAVGFTAGGVAAGSLAAAIQATIGSVGAGSLFAICQSIGAAGGLATGTVAVLGAGSAGAYVAVDTVRDKVKSRNDDEDGNVVRVQEGRGEQTRMFTDEDEKSGWDDSEVQSVREGAREDDGRNPAVVEPSFGH